MVTDFVIRVKYIILWHNRGLRVYFDLYAPDLERKKWFFFYFFHAKKSNLKCGHGLKKKNAPYFGSIEV